MECSPASSRKVLSAEQLQTPDGVSPVHKTDPSSASPTRGEEPDVEVGEEAGIEADGVDSLRFKDLQQR